MKNNLPFTSNEAKIKALGDGAQIFDYNHKSQKQSICCQPKNSARHLIEVQTPFRKPKRKKY